MAGETYRGGLLAPHVTLHLVIIWRSSRLTNLSKERTFGGFGGKFWKKRKVEQEEKKKLFTVKNRNSL